MPLQCAYAAGRTYSTPERSQNETKRDIRQRNIRQRASEHHNFGRLARHSRTCRRSSAADGESVAALARLTRLRGGFGSTGSASWTDAKYTQGSQSSGRRSVTCGSSRGLP
eukprot:1195382-Prorocentrum_minimum.AAC.1